MRRPHRPAGAAAAAAGASEGTGPGAGGELEPGGGAGAGEELRLAVESPLPEQRGARYVCDVDVSQVRAPPTQPPFFCCFYEHRPRRWDCNARTLCMPLGCPALALPWHPPFSRLPQPGRACSLSLLFHSRCPSPGLPAPRFAGAPLWNPPAHRSRFSSRPWPQGLARVRAALSALAMLPDSGDDHDAAEGELQHAIDQLSSSEGVCLLQDT